MRLLVALRVRPRAPAAELVNADAFLAHVIAFRGEDTTRDETIQAEITTASAFEKPGLVEIAFDHRHERLYLTLSLPELVRLALEMAARR